MSIEVNILGGKVLALVFLFCVFLQVSEGFGPLMDSCTDEQFRCFNGKCIDRNWFCDGRNDCPDRSDEEYCNLQAYSTCPKQEGKSWYQCDEMRRCYPRYFKCDGRTDCFDGSDERNCGNIVQRMTGSIQAQRNLIQTLRGGRKLNNSIKKWNRDLSRIATALFLFDRDLMSSSNATGQEMAYEISLQLLPKLMRNEIETHELSFYVNALIVSCIDPRDFFGIDVVAELRKRVTSDNYTNPFTILTLCNARDSMTSEDVDRVLTAFGAHYRPLWTDIQALATMALTCLSKQTNLTVDSQKLMQMTHELKMKQHKNGTVDNLKTTALVVQALLATESYKRDFDLVGAVRSMIQAAKFPSIMDSYYVLPIFGFKSLVDINGDHCLPPVETDVELLANLRDDQNERIQVQCSVFIGSRMDLIRTWKLKVPANHTFYQVLETIGSLEPQYKVRYDISNEKPYVTGVWKLVDDAIAETYWFVYKQALGSTDMPKLVHESPVDIEVNEKEELILWYRSGKWANSL